MAFLKALFKPMPNGTTEGNFLRDFFHNASPLLGNGAKKITQESYDMKELSDDLFAKKYGYTKNGIKTGIAPDKSIKTTEQRARDLATNQDNKGTINAVLEFAKKYWYITLLPFGFIIITIIWVFKKSKNRK